MSLMESAKASSTVQWILASAREYNLVKLRHDMVAGLTVSVVDLPQSMAFAVIAGVSPIYGIYTSIIQALIGGLLTSSAFLSNGPTNTQSLLVAAIVSRLAHHGSDDYLKLVIALSLIKGSIQLACGAARLGSLVRYVSSSVMVGFTGGAGVLIILEQVPAFMGISVAGIPRHYPGVIGAVDRLWPLLHNTHMWSLGLGMGCLVAVIVLRYISELIPGPLIAVGGAAAVVWWFGLDQQGMHVVGDLPSGLPQFALPSLSVPHVESLFGGALALALLGMLESVSIAKAIAMRTDHRINANQEFFGQGISNIVGSFFQCIPGSGSFSRSALQYTAGAKTRLCSVFCACFNLVFILMLSRQAELIPYPSLAAILFVVGFKLIDWHTIFRTMRTSKSDTAVCITTFVSALVLPLQYAIYVGIFLNLALYVRRASELHITEMVRNPVPVTDPETQDQTGNKTGIAPSPFIERPISNRHGQRRVMFLQVEGDLFFGLADELRDRLTEAAGPGVKAVILRLKRTHSVDASVLTALEQFTRYMQQRGGHVILCGLRPELTHRIEAFGLADVIGKDNIFETTIGVFASAKRALQRARDLTQESIDTTGFEDDEDHELSYEQWAYRI
ncbi:MAG: STAS domain-containing protein [Phycisphaera sp.]|nr:STAS domain-containing protein [Phycisphaera sp.]